MNKLLLILIPFAVISCKGKKETVTTEVVENVERVVDTVIIKETVIDTVYMPVENEINISADVDSTNTLKPFKYDLNTGQGAFTVESDGKGRLKIKAIGKEIINTARDLQMQELKNKEVIIKRENASVEKEVKIRTPFWIWPTIILLVVILVALVRKLFTKYSIKSLLPWK